MDEKNEQQPESDDQEKFSADVGDFVETLLQKQADYEAKVDKKIADTIAETNARIDAIDQVVKDALKKSLDTLNETINAKWKPRPGPQKASEN
jgi:hypothetical protein